MMNCNWLIRNTRIKRKMLIDIAKADCGNDLELKILTIAEINNMTGDQVDDLFELNQMIFSAEKSNNHGVA